MLNILSLGAGVQSSTLALMAAKGEITPMPDCALFADTGAEPAGVMKYLDFLDKELPFPIHRVMKDDGLLVDIEQSMTSTRFASPPFFTGNVDNKYEKGILRRHCTTDYKIVPLHQKIRSLLGVEPGQRAGKEVRAIVWIGISTDEAQRMKPSRDKWMENRWPLIENNISRLKCLEWMQKHGYPKPTKSACTFCPYHDDALWRDMKANDPESFAEAVRVDNLIREGGGRKVLKQNLFVHKSLTPLDEVDFRNAEDLGQGRLFDDECEGMCGV